MFETLIGQLLEGQLNRDEAERALSRELYSPVGCVLWHKVLRLRGAGFSVHTEPSDVDRHHQIAVLRNGAIYNLSVEVHHDSRTH